VRGRASRSGPLEDFTAGVRRAIENGQVRLSFKSPGQHAIGRYFGLSSVSEFAMLPTRRDHDARADFEATTRATVKGAT